MSAATTSTSRRGEFMRDRLPEPLPYFEGLGLPVTGKGKQRTIGCQIHGGSDSLGFTADTGAWLCRSCGAKGGDVLDHYMQVHGVGFVEAAKALGAWRDADGKEPAPARTPSKAAVRPVQAPQHSSLSDYGRELWGACRPVHGAARSYLTARRCALPPEVGDLRCHPSLKHPSGYIGPALVALCTDPQTGEPRTLHRTWVNPDGTKAEVEQPRLVLARHGKQGAVIRLWPDEAVTYGLAIAEGIETALSLAHAYAPAWSCLDAGNLAALPVLPGIETLVIGADNDPAGIMASRECAARWAAAGVEVLVTQQSENDINDALQGATT